MYFLEYKGLIRVACVSGALVFSCFPILASAQRQSSEDRCVQDLRADDGWVTRSANATQQMGMPAHHIATFATTLIKRAEGECRDAVRANPELQRIVANARTRLAGGVSQDSTQAGTRPASPKETLAMGGPSNADCFEKIKRIQSSGNRPIDNLQKQKELFQGECSRHPQAAGYVSAAERGIKEWEAAGESRTAASPRDNSPGSGGIAMPSAAAQAEALTRERAAGKKARDDAYAAGSGGTTTFLDPRTGKPCVDQLWADHPNSDKHVYMRFTNTCGSLYVSVTYKDGRGGPGGFVKGERDFIVSKEQARGGFSYTVKDKL